MTTCPRCGQPLRAPVPACPNCGERFALPAYQGQNNYDGQAAWMRQAQPPPRQPQQPQQYQQYQQYQQPPQPPAPQPPSYGQPPVRPGFSMNELVSEEALPEWLRQASADSAQPTQRQPIPEAPPSGSPQGYPPAYPPTYPAAYPAANQPAGPGYGGFALVPADEPPVARPDANAFPSIENAGVYQQPLAGGGGMPASSLLDPNALPSWLSGQQGNAAPESMRGGDGLRAQSLVDDAALPQWMRNEPESPAPALPAQGSFAPPAVPGWEGYAAAPAAPSAPALPPAGYAAMPPAPGPGPMAAPMPAPMNGQQGLSASQLIDANALPDWLVQGQAGAGGMAQPPVGMPPAAGMQSPAPGQPGQQGPWSASDLIDPAMLPGWVGGGDAAAQPYGGADYGAPRERTGRVPAPHDMNPADAGNSTRHRAAAPGQAERDYGMSRAGTAQRGAVSRKQPAARPLDDQEMPAWLREDAAGDYGRAGVPASPSGRQQRGGPSRNGYGDYNGQNGYDGYDGYGGQNGQPAPRGQRRQMPAGQTGQAWAAPDSDDSSPWARRPSTRHPARPPEAKKRRGGIFGFFRRG